jgi:hypothetical protein
VSVLYAGLIWFGYPYLRMARAQVQARSAPPPCSLQGKLDLTVRRLLRFLDKYPDHHNAAADGGNVESPRNPVPALHAHFPERPAHVLYMRLADPL